MALTREQKVALAEKRIQGSLTREDKEMLAAEKIARMQAQSSEPSVGRTLRVKAEEGATLGFRPVIAGAGAAAGAGIETLRQGRGLSEAFQAGKEAFFDARGEAVSEQDAIQQARPGLSAATSIASSIPTFAASPLRALSMGVKGGAAIGGITGLGQGLSRANDLEGVARDAAGSAVLGGLTGGALNLAGKGVQAVASSKLAQSAKEGLKRKAAEKALKALEGTASEIKKLTKTGRAEPMGERLLAEGAIPVLGTPSRILPRVQNSLKEAGKNIDEVYSALPEDKVIDANQVADKVMEAFSGVEDVLGGPEQIERVAKALDQVRKRGTLSLQEAWKLRKNIDKSIKNFMKDPGKADLAEANKQLRTVLRDEINEGVNRLNLPGVEKDLLKNLNTRFSELATARDILEGSVGRAANRRSISLTDTIVGAGGLTASAVSGSPAGIGLALGVGANKAIRTFGSSASARALNALSKVGGAGNQAVQEVTRGATGRALLSKTTRSGRVRAGDVAQGEDHPMKRRLASKGRR